jgi:hypothetical protein
MAVLGTPCRGPGGPGRPCGCSAALGSPLQPTAPSGAAMRQEGLAAGFAWSTHASRGAAWGWRVGMASARRGPCGPRRAPAWRGHCCRAPCSGQAPSGAVALLHDLGGALRAGVPTHWSSEPPVAGASLSEGWRAGSVLGLGCGVGVCGAGPGGGAAWAPGTHSAWRRPMRACAAAAATPCPRPSCGLRRVGARGSKGIRGGTGSRHSGCGPEFAVCARCSRVL